MNQAKLDGQKGKTLFFCNKTKRRKNSFQENLILILKQHRKNNSNFDCFLQITIIMKYLKILTTTLLFTFTVLSNAEEKKIYVPSSFGDMDLNSESSQWCYERSKETDNFILFWEAGYGSDPSTASSDYQVNTTTLLSVAEKSYVFYRDSLDFVEVGNSKTDSLKMIILLYYSTDWMASGSGVDDMIGMLNLSASAAQAGTATVAHEAGHCFQYQTHCDGFSGGWMYGFGSNGSGGNAWWEQCAQWQAFKVYPDQQFSNYLNYTHKHLLHETPRYANYFIQDYWCYLHGMDIIAKLWQESEYPEDPVEAYERLTDISQDEFNDEIYDCASRFITWDIPALKSYGKDYIDKRCSNSMTLDNDGYWMIDSADCIENYGYNTIRLNVPTDSSTIKIYFEGQSGESGYRCLNKTAAGWRFGVVALTEDEQRVYSEMKKAEYDQNFINNKDSLIFECPEDCKRLWLVVTGAPDYHWRHAWDNDDTNDEQWPYRVKFNNTNCYGFFDFDDEDTPENVTLSQDIYLSPASGSVSSTYPSKAVSPDWENVCKAFCLQLSDIQDKFEDEIKYCAITPSGSTNYTSTANYPGHWFNKSGEVTSWGSNSYVFSEFDIDGLCFSIGQYPSICSVGDQYTIRQGLVYTPTSGNSVTAKFVFNIHIVSETELGIEKQNANSQKQVVINTLVNNYLYLKEEQDNIKIFSLTGQQVLSRTQIQNIDLTDLCSGIYIVVGDRFSQKIIKK